MRKLCLILAFVLILTALAGCNQNKTNSNSESSGGVTITVVTPFDATDGNYNNYVNAYTAYENATGNTVRDQSAYANEEWKAQIIADFEAGNEPDVLFFFTGADADSMVNNDQVIPISTIQKEHPTYAGNMKSSMIPVSPADGRQYAVPVNGYWEGLFVNKKVLATCGIDIPDENYTWEQFLNDCQIIKDNGYTPIACSLNEVPHYWFEFCTFNYGSVINHAALPASSGDGTGKIWAEGLNDIKLLYDSGFFPADTNTMTDGEANLLMTDNKAAFMIDGSWKIGWFQTNAADLNDFTVTYVPAKGERKATEIVGGLSMGYYITQKAWDDPEKRQACVDFILAMTTDEVVTTFGSLSVTALKNGIEAPVDADPLVLSALAMTKGCTGIVPAAQDGLSQAARIALFNDVKNIVTGTITPEEAIDNCLSIK